MDVNMSLRSMLAPKAASGVANPWKTILGCLTENCKVFMRKCRDRDPKNMEYIFLTGVELMQLVGWHRGFFCREVDLLSMETQALLASSLECILGFRGHRLPHRLNCNLWLA